MMPDPKEKKEDSPGEDFVFPSTPEFIDEHKNLPDNSSEYPNEDGHEDNQQEGDTSDTGDKEDE